MQNQILGWQWNQILGCSAEYDGYLNSWIYSYHFLYKYYFFIFLLYIQIYLVQIYFVCIVFLKLKLNNRSYKNHIQIFKYLYLFQKQVFICIIFMINLQFVFYWIQRPKLLVSDIIFIRINLDNNIIFIQINLDNNFLIWIYSDIWLYKCQCSGTEFRVKFSQFQPTATWRIKINQRLAPQLILAVKKVLLFRDSSG